MNNLKRKVSKIRQRMNKLADDLGHLESLLSNNGFELDPKEVILPEEMADIFERSVPTIRRWIKEGKLTPVYKKGSSYYWLRSELKQILSNDK